MLNKYSSCLTPGDDDEPTATEPFQNMCGKPATQERSFMGVLLPMCEEHAAQFDEDLEAEELALKAEGGNGDDDGSLEAAGKACAAKNEPPRRRTRSRKAR